MPAYKPIIERFTEKYEVNPETGCWDWKGAKVAGGYGQISGERGAGNKPAHVFAYETFVGPVPKGKILRHSCDDPGCVNPYHQIPGTHADNMRDMAHRGRRVGRGAGTSMSPDTVSVVRGLLSEGLTFVAAGAVVGVHADTVGRAWKRGEFGTNEPRPPSRRFLTDEERDEVVRLLAAGERVMVVAKRFGADRKTIRNIRPDHIPSPPMGRPAKGH